MEEVSFYLLISILEDAVDHTPVVFRVSESDWYLGMLGIKVAEADLQRKKEKSVSIRKVGVVLEYHGTQLVCHLCQVAGTLSPPGQVSQHVWEKTGSRVRGADGRSDRLGQFGYDTFRVMTDNGDVSGLEDENRRLRTTYLGPSVLIRQQANRGRYTMSTCG